MQAARPERRIAEPAGAWLKGQGAYRELVINVTNTASAKMNHYVYGGKAGNNHARIQGHARWGNYIPGASPGHTGESDTTMLRYARWLLHRQDKVDKARRELQGKVLGCFCAPNKCHLHILAEVANCDDAQLREMRRAIGVPDPPTQTRDTQATRVAIQEPPTQP